MCEECERLKNEEEAAIRKLDRAQALKDGALPNPAAMTQAERVYQRSLDDKITAAREERVAAHERRKKHRIECGAGGV